MVAKGSKMSEESCRKMSEAHKGKPAWNKGVHSPGPMEGKKHTQETIEKMSIAKKGKPSLRVGYRHSESTKKKLREKAIGRPGYWRGKTIPDSAKEKLRLYNTGRRLSEDHKRRISETQKNRPHSEEHIMRVVESRIGGFWYGNVGASGPQYCEVWRLVRPRIVAFFGHICVECEGVIEDKDPCCHHVFYEKKACCMVDEDGEFFSNLNIPNHAKDYHIGKNPNYFVTLCVRCHSKTNGSYESRKRWADHFKELIDTKYGGKCYLTEEEFESYKKERGME